jgi:glycosyltransferase involved in cell wall biosynthesis
MNKKSILFKAPMLTASGYGVHARQISKVLLENFGDQVKFMPTMWGSTGWILNDSDNSGLIQEIVDKIEIDNTKKFDLSLQLLLPDEWNLGHGLKNIGITAGVETDKCSEKWIECCNNIDEVIVPSQFTKKTFLDSGKLNKEIKVIGEETYVTDSMIGLDSDFEKKNGIETNFNVLIFGQITGTNPQNDRKNLFLTIKELCEIFKDDKDFGIILKTNASRNTPIDREYVIYILNAVLAQVRQGEFPRVYLLHGNMSQNDMIEMYNAKTVRAMVTLTRGEGMGLPLLEAASANVPIISVNWSGQLDFLNLGKFIKVDYELQQVHESRIDNRIFIKGAKWAEYNKENFKKRMNEFRQSFKVPKDWAIDLGKKIRQKHSHEEISKKYIDLIKKYI